MTEDIIHGQPNKITLHGIEFKNENAGYYRCLTWTRAKNNSNINITAEKGVWHCNIQVWFSTTRKENVPHLPSLNSIEGSSSIIGTSINISDAVALALRGLSRSIVEYAAFGHNIGLTGVLEEDLDEEEKAPHGTHRQDPCSCL